jgi:hypothetical protein
MHLIMICCAVRHIIFIDDERVTNECAVRHIIFIDDERVTNECAVRHIIFIDDERYIFKPACYKYCVPKGTELGDYYLML